MSVRVRAMAGRAAPWREGAPWWLALVEGVLALALGAWILVGTEQVRDLIVPVAGGWLAVVSVLQIVAGLRGRQEGTAPRLVLVRGGVGLAVGVLVVMWSLAADAPSARPVLGIGLVLCGLIGLAVAATAHGSARARGLRALEGLLLVLVGGLFLPGGTLGGRLLNWAGVVAVVAGGLLVAYSVWLSRGQRTSPQQPPAPAEGPGGGDVTTRDG